MKRGFIRLLAADSDHPNKRPFEGVLCYFDQASDNPVGGAKGNLVYISSGVGERLLDTIAGMGVNVKSDFSGHNVKYKIGVIEKAWLSERQDDGSVPVNISGYLYASDFPDEIEDIEAEQDDLGWSYEMKAMLEKMSDQPRPTVEVTDGIFTGATILYRTKAAYTRTSLAAEQEDDMNEEELKKALEAMGLGNLEEIVSMFKEVQKAMSEKGVYTSLSMYLSAGAEAVEKVSELSEKVGQLEGALSAANEKVVALESDLAQAKALVNENSDKLNASAAVHSDEEFKALQTSFNELKASHDELKAKIDAKEAALKAEAEAKEMYARRSSAGLQLMAKYDIQPKDDLQAEIDDIGKRNDIDTVEKMTLIMEAQARHKKQAQ